MKGIFTKRRISSALLCLMLLASPISGNAQGFSDTQSNWARRYIEYYQAAGVINGSGNNRFAPNGAVTAGEFAIILGRVITLRAPQLLKISANPDKNFTSNHFTPDSFLFVLEKIGLLEGIPLSTEFPSQKLTRATVNSMLNNLEKILAQNPNSNDEPTNPSSVDSDDEKSNASDDENDESSAAQPQSLESAPESSEHIGEPTTDVAQPASPLTGAEALAGTDNTKGKTAMYRPDWYRPENGALYAPNQFVTRAELMQLLYHIFESQILSHGHKVELPITHISQMTPVVAPVGCEPVSMLMALRYKGFAKDVTIRQYLDALPKHKNDPEIAFAGSPYTPNEALRTTIFPTPLANYGQSYGAQAVDISGASVEDLKEQLYNGNPVVVYVTLFWQKPYYKSYIINGEKRTYLRNNHALLLAGYDPSTHKFLMVDPYNVKGMKAKYWYDESKFTSLYNARQHAVAIQ